ncbi:MAG: hypothetical protein LBT59_25700 [Clostridiales bacterium]|jgi:hypothetical protein|nr:hypothetical protein [Clostridiales bacterium]
MAIRRKRLKLFDVMQGAGEAVKAKADGVLEAGSSIKKKIDDSGALKNVANAVSDAGVTVRDITRAIIKSPLPEVAAGALGFAGGTKITVGLINRLGKSGLSASGITSALTVAGSIVKGGMMEGVIVLASPIAVLTVVGVATVREVKHICFKTDEERSNRAMSEKNQAILISMTEDVAATTGQPADWARLQMKLLSWLDEYNEDYGLGGSEV